MCPVLTPFPFSDVLLHTQEHEALLAEFQEFSDALAAERAELAASQQVYPRREALAGAAQQRLLNYLSYVD